MRLVTTTSSSLVMQEEEEEFLGRDERNQEDLESLQLHIQEQEGVIR